MPRPNAKVKSVHFNITNEADAGMLKHIGRRNFSRYVKQLIKTDIEKKKELPKPQLKKVEVKYLPKQT